MSEGDSKNTEKKQELLWRSKDLQDPSDLYDDRFWDPFSQSAVETIEECQPWNPSSVVWSKM